MFTIISVLSEPWKDARCAGVNDARIFTPSREMDEEQGSKSDGSAEEMGSSSSCDSASGSTSHELCSYALS